MCVTCLVHPDIGHRNPYLLNPISRLVAVMVTNSAARLAGGLPLTSRSATHKAGQVVGYLFRVSVIYGNLCDLSLCLCASEYS